MTFGDAVEKFECSESGTDSFKFLHRALLKLMQTDPANAAAYYILGTAAHNYVSRYEDQGVDPATADAAKASLLDLCKRFIAVADAASQEKFSVLSSIANDYEWKIVSF